MRHNMQSARRNNTAMSSLPALTVNVMGRKTDSWDCYIQINRQKDAHTNRKRQAVTSCFQSLSEAFLSPTFSFHGGWLVQPICHSVLIFPATFFFVYLYLDKIGCQSALVSCFFFSWRSLFMFVFCNVLILYFSFFPLQIVHTAFPHNSAPPKRLINHSSGCQSLHHSTSLLSTPLHLLFPTHTRTAITGGVRPISVCE